MPTIRPAQRFDAAEIAALTAQLGYAAAPATTRERLQRLLAGDDDRVIVACQEGRIVGWLQAHASCALESGDRVEIVGLVVADHCRRTGVGRALVQRAEAWAIEQGAESLVVRSNTLRTESHRFYPALGFTISKTQTVYRKTLPTPTRSRDQTP